MSNKMWIAAALTAGLGVSSASAAVMELDNGPTASTYTVSSGDLINGLTPATTGNFGPTSGDSFSTNDPTVLTDGNFGAANPNTESGTGRSTVSIQSGATVTYTLPASANGYNITSIATYAGWQDNGRDNQTYDVLYSTVAAPTTFLPLASVNYNPGGSSAPSNDSVTLTDTTGILASNVQAIEFAFGVQENGYVGYRELDVFGTTATPEPASAALVGIAAVGLLARRRKA